MTQLHMVKTITTLLNDNKGQDICVLDVQNLTAITDYMIVVTGSSDRHVKALARFVIDGMKQDEKTAPLAIEGDREGDWIIVDYSFVMVHVMLDEQREFYELERLWTDPDNNNEIDHQLS